MEHERQTWYTCDKCGEYIGVDEVPSLLSKMSYQRKKILEKADIYTHTVSPKNCLADITPILPEIQVMEITEYYDCEHKHYHLCGKCRKEFERWIKSGRKGN